MTKNARLITRLETAKSSRLNCTSNLRASWLKKTLLWVSFDSSTTRAVPHLSFLCKTGDLLCGTSFYTHWFHRLSCLTAAKRSLAFQRLHRTKKFSMRPYTVVKAIIYHKFQYLPGYQVDKNWRALLSNGPEYGSRWLKSVLFLSRSDSISVALLGSN